GWLFDPHIYIYMYLYLRGTYVSVKGKEAGVHAYLGVPFAKPPVGPALRFAAPQPVEGWEGVKDATQQPPMCVQDREQFLDLIDTLGMTLAHIPDISEDCLYLNIYTPTSRVMVWIHGGGFTMGSASMYDGSALAAYQEVVVVLIQYRLGLLGFLSTGDEHMSGNFGMLDQVEALRWIQQHIHNFGGDPDLVTIFGESAGGVSVSLLLLSPLSDGLFHHAIAESGTAAMDILFSKELLPLMQVNYYCTYFVFKCFSVHSAENITTQNLYFSKLLTWIPHICLQDDKSMFPLVIDGHFLTKPVDELFHKHELLTLPFMTGVNNDEGGWILTAVSVNAALKFVQLNRLLIFLHESMKVMSKKLIAAVELLIEEYLGIGDDRVKNREGITELLGDVLFNIPAIKTANSHRDAGAPVYLYEYQHPPKFLQVKRPSFVGTDHGDEIFTVLGFCFTTTHVKLAGECKIKSTNMCLCRSPNGDGLVHWPKYGAEEEYLAIGLKKQVTAQHLKKDRFVFLTQTLPEKVQQLTEKMEHSEL
uniref:Carboxylic ester hydrolase n=1 Tax=Monopterus albus TaxID=43700 RepID=A0A3Q3KBZ2_MONAL